MFDRKVIGRGMPKPILWQSHPIAAHVRSTQVQNAHLETLDAPDLSFDIGDCGHGTAFESSLNPSMNRVKCGDELRVGVNKVYSLWFLLNEYFTASGKRGFGGHRIQNRIEYVFVL